MLALLIPAFAHRVELQPGSAARLTFRDVDGRDLSTAAGYVTIITVATRQDEDKARAVADLVPDRYVGDARYRYVTMVNFERKLARPLHGLTRAIIRQRLDAEAKKLKPNYEAKKIARDPRRDIYVVADFDGSAVAQLGLAPESQQLAVFVFNRQGKLIQRWNELPPNDSLGRAIAAAD